ncbi:MAG: hypothetical protein LM564_02190 [Desulfurococcaceae archaeon]|nr:hypothetical protein [Desulfurococcaceae archaeon]
MPEWVVHRYTAGEFCKLSRGVCDEVDRFVDLNPLGHDTNRIIINGHWLPEALLHLAAYIYERWGYEGLKCMLHHNLLDYARTLASSGPYGAMIRRLALPENAEVRITTFVRTVLDNIVNDFLPILKIFECSGGVYDAVQRVEGGGLWRVEDLGSFVKVLKEPYITDFLKDLLKATDELRSCVRLCVLEVVMIKFYNERRFKDLCPWCSTSTYGEDFILIPKEYVSHPKNLAFRVHRSCFEELVRKAKEILNEGLDEREVLDKVMVKYMPPSIVWEAVKRAREV